MAEVANIEKRSIIKLILPDRPHYDSNYFTLAGKEFLETMSKVFHWLRWLGVAGRERFVWKIWGVFIIFLYVAIECQAIWKVIKAIAGWAADTTGNRSITVRFAGTIFYISTMICWRLSSSWTNLSKYWASIEVATIKLPLDTSVRKQMHTAILFVAFCSILEHLMSILASSDFNCSFNVWLRKYILTSHGFLFLEHQYKDWYTIPLLFMSNLATIVWNLLDLLIILISIGLRSRYRRLNQYVAILTKKKHKNLWSQNIETLKLHSWRKIREEYVKQAKLVRKVDSLIGGVILASSFFNFYFICLQLFLGITNGLTGSLMQQIYYVLSFSWLCVRTVCSVLAAANVNVASKSALIYLYRCPPQIYNIETERLQYQLTEDFVALSGFGLFYLQKKTVLQMAAAVLTYALVLIQYDNSDQNIFNVNRNKKITTKMKLQKEMNRLSGLLRQLKRLLFS